VNGESTRSGEAFSTQSVPGPLDLYGSTKHQAEMLVRDFCAHRAMRFTIIRPPLVYGRGVKGNFARLVALARRPIPLPFASIDNRRSMINVRNLADFIARCVCDDRAFDQVFLVSDDQDLSTAELVAGLRTAHCRPALLFPMPPSIFVIAARVLGREEEFGRLFGSLQLDPSWAIERMNWKPRWSIDQGLADAVDR